MIDLGTEMARALKVDWTASRAQSVEDAMHGRRRRRARVRVLGAAAVVAALVVGWVASRTPGDPTPALARVDALDPAPASTIAVHPTRTADGTEIPGRELVLSDASRATPDPDATLRVVSEGPNAVVLELSRGASRFEVVSSARRFEVVAGRVTVRAFGARFAAAHVEGGVRVEVTSGEVLVAWQDEGGGGERPMTVGASAVFPPPALASERPRDARPAPRRASATERVDPDSDRGWRELAQQGAFDQAYQALARPDAVPARDVPEELLLLADVRRLSHHSEEAVAPLRQVMRDHAGDARAPLAAFTLGRVLLDLDRFSEAAAAFAETIRLAPSGPLVEHALARRVEATARAGDAAAARALALDYVARFPAGRRLSSVRRDGGLE